MKKTTTIQKTKNTKQGGLFPAQIVADRLKDTIGSGIDFEYCAVRTPHTRRFQILNITDTSLHFEIESEPVFNFSPNHGRIAPKSKLEISVTHTPLEAKVVVAQALLKLSGQNAGEAVVKVKTSAIGKYPFASLSQTRLDFGDILVGSISDQLLKIKNASPVPVDFSIDRVSDIASQEGQPASPESRRDSDSSNAFTLDFYRGVIPAG